MPCRLKIYSHTEKKLKSLTWKEIFIFKNWKDILRKIVKRQTYEQITPALEDPLLYMV